MNQLNNIILEGTLINEPEVVAKSAVTNSRLVKFTIANDRFYKDVNGNPKQETLFLVIQCWGELGEKALACIHKGMVVRTVGRLMMCRWESKTGEKRSTIEIVCNHIEYRMNSKNKESKLEVLEDEKKEADVLCESTVLYEF